MQKTEKRHSKHKGIMQEKHPYILIYKKKMLKKFTWIERAKACASASSSDIPPCTDCR